MKQHLGVPVRPGCTDRSLDAWIRVFSLTTALTIFSAAANAQFTSPPGGPVPVGNGPYSAVSGDFNGDGRTDIAVANFNDSTVTLLLGNGNGGFTPAAGSPFPTGGTGPYSLAAADINGDGFLDLIMTNFTSGTGTALFGDGMGGFTPPKNGGVTLGANPYGVALADFDGNGMVDIAVANSGSDNVTVLLQGSGSGGPTQAPGSPFTVGSAPFAIVVGDFNGDGIPDIATANSGSNNVTILLGNGNGGFGAAIPTAVGSLPMALAVGDFNGDGKLDLVVANEDSTTVTVLLGNGHGGFTPASASPLAVGGVPRAIAVADFNGDGIPDLVVCTTFLTLFTGDGTGGFNASGNKFSAGAGPAAIVVGDFNRDGQPDVAIPDSLGNAVIVQLNGYNPITVNPTSLTFYADTVQPAPPGIAVSVTSMAGATYTATPTQPWLTPASASNPTGGLSSVTVSANQNSLAAGTYSGKMRFTAPNYFGAVTNVTLHVENGANELMQNPNVFLVSGSGPIAVATGDFNGDGILDLITADINSSNLAVLLGNGNGSFNIVGSIGNEIAGPHAVAVGDFNGDGKLDIAVANYNANNVTILLGNGAGGFTPTPYSPYSTGVKPISIAVGDFNRDGIPDLAIADFGSNDVTVLLGLGYGDFTYASNSPVAAGGGPFSVAIGDFNQDGLQDLAVADVVNNNVTILLGNRSAGFSQAQGSPYAVGSGPSSIVVADFNRDGMQDLAISNNTGNTVSVLLGNGMGAFTQAGGSPIAVTGGPLSLVAGDFNGDGLLDIATANSNSNNVTVLQGNGMGGFAATPYSPLAVGSNPRFIVTGDFNGDGRADLVTVNNSNSSLSILVGHSTGNTAQTIAFGPLTTMTYGASPFVIGATASSGLAVSFASATPSVCTVTGGTTVNIFSAGSCSIVASQAGNATYMAAATVTQSFTVNPAAQTISFAPLSNLTYGAAPFTLTATTSSGLPVSYVSTTTAICTLAGKVVTIVAVGGCSITANQLGNMNFNPAPSVQQSFTANAPAAFSELGIFRAPAGGQGGFWLDLNQSTYNFDSTAQFWSFGSPGDQPVAGDWTGNGVISFGVFRQGVWYIDLNNNGTWDGVAGGDAIYYFGQPGDIATPGDWNGTGVTKLGVFRCPAASAPGGCTWYLDAGNKKGWDPATAEVYTYGQTGDLPVVNNWNGTGSADQIGVFRCTQAPAVEPCSWIVDNVGDGVYRTSDPVYVYGQTGDLPVVGNWSTGPQRKRIGVFRGGTWFLETLGTNSYSPADTMAAFGVQGDLPVVGSWTTP